MSIPVICASNYFPLYIHIRKIKCNFLFKICIMISSHWSKCMCILPSIVDRETFPLGCPYRCRGGKDPTYSSQNQSKRGAANKKQLFLLVSELYQKNGPHERLLSQRFWFTGIRKNKLTARFFKNIYKIFLN